MHELIAEARAQWKAYLAAPAGQDAEELARTRLLLDEIVSITPLDHEELGFDRFTDPGWFTTLGSVALERHERNPGRRTIRLATDAFRESVRTTQAGTAEHAGAWSNLAIALRTEYYVTNLRSTLDDAVDAHTQALAVPAAGIVRATRAVKFAATLLARHEEFGDTGDLDEAARIGQSAIAWLPPGSPGRPDALSDLSTVFYRRYERGHGQEDLEQAEETARLAVAEGEAGHPARGNHLFNLANALHLRYLAQGDSKLLDEAITVLTAGVPLLHGDPVATGSYGDLLRERYELTGDPQDSASAINALREALAQANAIGRPSLTLMLESNLASAHRARFEREGDAEDLAATLRHGRQVIANSPPGHPDLAANLSNLSNYLRIRFQVGGDIRDLTEAITTAEKALDECREGDGRKARFITNLSAALALRYEHAGNRGDLDKAVVLMRRAVSDTPKGDARLSLRGSALANMLFRRFELHREPEDLSEAADLAAAAVSRTPRGSSTAPGRLMTLAAILAAHHQRTGAVEQLNLAIEAARDALSAGGAGHRDAQLMRSNLSEWLRQRFTITGARDDIDEAVQLLLTAVGDTPTGHPDRAIFLSNLGMCLRDRGEPGDLVAAVQRHRLAADASSSVDKATTLLQLGRCLHDLAEMTGSDDVRAEAVEAMQMAAEVGPARPRTRIIAAHTAAVTLADDDDWAGASESYRRSLDLLPMLAWIGLSRAGREEQLGEWSGLAGEAAASAIAERRPEAALAAAEHGRAVLWGQLMALRPDFTALAAESRELAERLRAVSEQLEAESAAGLGTSLDLPG
ncbi:hypothetical protein [Amycolatopsis sp. CA-126428]|uniref:hypothetical protein n=1 Tax=Amycolatopsis sp. CA-126428 TaxID=2073158 RepID=UPI0011B03192|nr:hypothetical protein [Amycolatopsis sp. CA-126428]